MNTQDVLHRAVNKAYAWVGRPSDRMVFIAPFEQHSTLLIVPKKLSTYAGYFISVRLIKEVKAPDRIYTVRPLDPNQNFQFLSGAIRVRWLFDEPTIVIVFSPFADTEDADNDK